MNLQDNTQSTNLLCHPKQERTQCHLVPTLNGTCNSLTFEVKASLMRNNAKTSSNP